MWPGAVKLLKWEGRQVSDKRLCDWYWYLKMWVSVLGAVTLFLAPNSSQTRALLLVRWVAVPFVWLLLLLLLFLLLLFSFQSQNKSDC